MSYFSMGYGVLPIVSSEEVKQAVEEIAPEIIDGVVDTKVDAKMEEVIREGESDDVKTYQDFNKFPGQPGNTDGKSPIKDVEYIDESNGYEYIWNGTTYMLLNEHKSLDADDINGLGNWS